MREIKNTKIIAVDHGYGNIKTANTVMPTGITAYETEPIFTGNILEYNGTYYRIGEGHKEFIPDKAMDEDYYLLTLMAVARELKRLFYPESRCPSGCRASPDMDPEPAGRIPFLSASESRSQLPLQQQGLPHPLCWMQPLSTGIPRNRKPSECSERHQSPCRYRERHHEHPVYQQ